MKCYPLSSSQIPVLDVSASLSFSLWAVLAEIRGPGSWMEGRGSSSGGGSFPPMDDSLWMSVILGNVPREQMRKPLNPAELLRGSVFDKRLPPWSASLRVLLIKRVKARSCLQTSWSSVFGFQCSLGSSLSAPALSYVIYSSSLSLLLYTKGYLKPR